MDDSLIDLILESQGRRMDDQRSAVPFTLRSNESKEVEPKEKSREERGEELIALVRRTPEPVIREQNRRLSQASMDSLNEGFIDQLMTAQVSCCCCCCCCLLFLLSYLLLRIAIVIISCKGCLCLLCLCQVWLNGGHINCCWVKSCQIEECLVMQSGEESSSSGHFNPVGRLQQSNVLLR